MSKEIKLKIMVNTSLLRPGTLLHRIKVQNIEIGKLDVVGTFYNLTLEKQNKNQKIHFNILISSNLIKQSENFERENLTCVFHNRGFDISIKRTIDIDSISKVSGSQVIKYYLSMDDVKFTVKNYMSMKYYKSIIVYEAQASVRKDKMSKTNSLTSQIHKKKRTNKKGLSIAELRQRDFYYADEYTYPYSPNSDSKRSKHETLGGTGSNMYRRRK
ncbi:hypothetical protein [Guptibacillus algicola]|uniref:hypothetical protein n=1 Tax=Guptibacillus algicola TaxID=225844 RepID=UPI001CD64EEF|nr:hypothetical protein [Alkalihalobacillus algicola]MCA0987275.1 hypothetical protein [Alkalihalobacillus algicola]